MINISSYFIFTSVFEWTFVSCTKMCFDIHCFCPLLRAVLVSAMKYENAAVAISDIPFHAFNSNFYYAALNVLPEAPCINSLPLRIKCNLNSSHHVWKRNVLKDATQYLSWIKTDWHIINIVIDRQCLARVIHQILLLEVFLSQMNKNLIKILLLHLTVYFTTMSLISIMIIHIYFNLHWHACNVFISLHDCFCIAAITPIRSALSLIPHKPLVAILQTGHMVAVYTQALTRVTWKTETELDPWHQFL